MSIAEAVYLVTRNFPQSELYGMTGQIRRAAASIAANIAEGNGRETSRAYVQFLRISQGSLKELETHLLLAQRVGIAEPQQIEPILGDCDKLGRMIRALIRVIQDKVRAEE